jgi:two-component system CheB/CheR fusion protein
MLSKVWILNQTVKGKESRIKELEERVNVRTNALNESSPALENSNRELQQFAFVSSHDLQEPLRKIVTFSNMPQKKYKEQLPEPAQERNGNWPCFMQEDR